MGLFDRSKQVTTTNTDITNISDDSTSVIQDAYNTITSTTEQTTTNFTDSFNSIVSQPIAIMANGSDGGGLNLDAFFSNANPLQGKEGGNPLASIGPIVTLAIVGALIYFGFKLLKKRK